MKTSQLTLAVNSNDMENDIFADLALTERASGPRTRSLLRLLGVPSVVDVQGLFRWASDGDVALVDADHGLLVINPSKSEISGVREFKRSQSIPPGPPEDDSG